jgi:hypothetical protein
MAILAAASTARAIVRGDAAAGSGIERDRFPISFWTIVAAAAALTIGFLYVAVTGHSPRWS